MFAKFGVLGGDAWTEAGRQDSCRKMGPETSDGNYHPCLAGGRLEGSPTPLPGHPALLPFLGGSSAPPLECGWGSHPNLAGHTARVGHLVDEGRGRTPWCHTLHRTENRVPLPKLWASGRTTDFRRRVRLGPDTPLGTSPGPWGTVGVPLTPEVGIGVEHRAVQKSAFDGRGGRPCRGRLPFTAADPKLLPRTSGHPPPQSPHGAQDRSRSLPRSAPDGRRRPWSLSTFLHVSRKSRALRATPFFKGPEEGAALSLGSGVLRSPMLPIPVEGLSPTWEPPCRDTYCPARTA